MFIQTRRQGPLAACLLNDCVLQILFVENLGASWSSGGLGPATGKTRETNHKTGKTNRKTSKTNNYEEPRNQPKEDICLPLEILKKIIDNVLNNNNPSVLY